MSHAYFVTGTDTGVGKTFCSVALLEAANKLGKTTSAVKPVAAGCELTPEGPRNDDALQLQQAASNKTSYDDINPYPLIAPIAPHLAAAEQGVRLDLADIVEHCKKQMNNGADLVLIEGAGGWRVPLNENHYFSDIARSLDIQVILVIDVKLGCLNHALLTQEAIYQDGLSLAGWVANSTAPQRANYDENLTCLKSNIRADLLGCMAYMPGADGKKAYGYVNVNPLL